VNTLVTLYSGNGFEIVPSQDNNQTRQHIIGDYKVSTTTLLMCWQTATSLSHLYIKE